jgi:aspartyl-tRNA(Asn)/glutamyl-tRNA(Gln) amidotransferase subunit C
MVTKEEVQRIAKLARLGLTEKEVEKFQKELSLILDYIEKLKEADVSGVDPLSHPFEVKNVSRKDEISITAKSQKLLELAPEEKKGYLKVKSIL